MTARTYAARIAFIEPGSIAEAVALQPGDLLLTVNGAPLADYIAYRFAIAEEIVTLLVARDDRQWEIEIEKETDDDLGLGFADDVFDGMRRCGNHCVFCFEDQMPAGMRASLHTRDDDFRLSFLHGNFITLTNLRAADSARIIREHLTPLYVSIHATDPAARRRMMRNPRAGQIMEQLRRLGEAGIELHTQIVLCPGWNDGAVLERTLADLAGLYPAVQSVGIVPVGLTAHRPDGPAVRPVAREDAEAVLETVDRWQAAMHAQHETRLIFAADEFYYHTGRPFPRCEAYEGYPQRENGIGLSRIFLDELAGLTRFPAGKGRKITLATGILAAELLEALAARLRRAHWDARVLTVPNTFYGGGVNVAGLLTGQDLLAALRGQDLGERLFLPGCALNADGVLLDDMPPDTLAEMLGVPLSFCSGPDAVKDALRT